jgi:hypothetical protein
MGLALVVLALFGLALMIVQGWTIWYLRREIQRLDGRVNESLDDEDLIEFQERLKGLLSQAKETAVELAETVEKRRESLEAALAKAKEAEKIQALRALERAVVHDAAAPPKEPVQARVNGAISTGEEAPRKERREDKVRETKAGKTRDAVFPPLETPKAGGDESPPPAKTAESAAKALRTLKNRSRENRPSKSKAAKTATAVGGLSEEADERTRVSSLRGEKGSQTTLKQRVYELADQGLAREQIAKQSGLLIGEVDLILNLRAKGPEA